MTVHPAANAPVNLNTNSPANPTTNSPANPAANHTTNPAARTQLLLASLAGFTGVLAGTFAAHLLKGRLPPESLATFEVGVRYHLLHAVAMLALAMFTIMDGHQRPARSAIGFACAGWLFFAGIMVFSGSLYALAITDEKRLGMITPLGGALFLLGWLTIAVSAWRSRKPTAH